MHLSIPSLFTLLATLLLTVHAQTTNSTDYEVVCLSFPAMVFGNATFMPEAITGLSKAIGGNTYNPPLPSTGIKLAPGSATRVGYAGSGGYQICLQNFYVFKTLTVSLEDVSAAVAQIESTCCSDTPNTMIAAGRRGRCQDAKALVKAEDGSNIKIVGQDYGDRCCGMWGC